MNSIIACIGDSGSTDSICSISAWIAKQTSLPVSLLHVSSPHYDTASKIDLDEEIGLGSKSDLLKKLTAIDENHNKLEQRKGKLLLAHAIKELAEKNIKSKTIQRRDSLSHTVLELESKAEIFVIGKHIGRSNPKSNQLGHNVESVAQTIHKPLLVVPHEIRKIKRFLIAFDGSFNSQKAVDYVIKSPLLKGLECHLLKVGEANEEVKKELKSAEKSLKEAGFKVNSQIILNKLIDNTVVKYIADNTIDLLVIGSYGHSKIHTLIFGSTTTSLLRKSNVPVLLFR